MDKENVYDVYDVSSGISYFEQLGTKEKYWFHSEWDGPDIKWLFKYSRENTGEHWSEKAAEQLCNLLGIPHAEYQLARTENRLGVLTMNLAPDGYRLIMGNEILYQLNPIAYPQPENEAESFMHIKEHTIKSIFESFEKQNVQPPKTRDESGLDGMDASDVFCGYLMLDALISNQDRHHENWAVLENTNTGELSLCPTFDHAASLGRELLDMEREERLQTKDKNRQVEYFVKKAYSEIFESSNDKKPLRTVDAFFESVKNREKTKKTWLTKLESLTREQIISIFDRMPDNVITPLARDFAVEMVLANKKRLLEDERS